MKEEGIRRRQFRRLLTVLVRGECSSVGGDGEAGLCLVNMDGTGSCIIGVLEQSRSK